VGRARSPEIMPLANANGKAKPEGRNREALVALRKLGKREVRGILAAKAEEARPESRGRGKGRRRKKRR